MLTSQRKRLILERLVQRGQVVAKELGNELAVSEDTIRRDLRELAAEGLLQRVHGGALPASPTVVALDGRRSMSTGSKGALARAAARMIGAGQVVIFDGGTSNLEIVRHLPPGLAFTAVTHSPTIAAAMEPHPAVEVVVIGGRLYRHSMVATGATTMEGIGRIRADLFFLGVTGVHHAEGLTTGDFEEAAVKRALMQRSAETVVLATAEKIGAASPFHIAAVSDVATLLVPASSVDAAAPLAEAGVTVVPVRENAG